MAATGRTPLQERLAGHRGRAGPLDAFRAARRAFLDGERVDMGELARSLEVNRATLYRWVGSREGLLVEIVWALTRRSFERLLADPDVVEPGRARCASVLARWAQDTIDHPGMRAFVEHEGELAMRLLTTRATDFQARLLALVDEVVAADLAAGAATTDLPREDVAYVVVRVVESFVYLSLITGERPDPDRPGRVLHGLLRASDPRPP